ncbi:hypothetical protein E4T56_gene5181 [Termitomyces sp. T112]|nr:hypothetical protein E4T56_gene5181 [Termitomyces sp. T112]
MRSLLLVSSKHSAILRRVLAVNPQRRILGQLQRMFMKDFSVWIEEILFGGETHLAWTFSSLYALFFNCWYSIAIKLHPVERRNRLLVPVAYDA